jgi:hypothetical protein
VAGKQLSRDKGKGRAIETPQEPPPMVGPVYDLYYDNYDGSDWDDGPLAYSNVRDAQQFRESVTARAESLPWNPSYTLSELVQKSDLKGDRKVHGRGEGL